MQTYESDDSGGLAKSHEAWASLPSRALLNLLSPGGMHGRLSILIYHRVPLEPDPLFPENGDGETFDRQMGELAACFKIISLLDAVQALRQGTLPPRAACITFDDGYADNAEVALPILQKHNIPATFFVSTSFLNGGRMWNDTVIELIRRAPGDRLDLSRMELGQFEIGTIPQRRQAIYNILGELKYLPLEARRSKVEAMCALIPVIPSSNLMMTSEQVRALHDAGMGIGGHTANHPILASMENHAARTEIADGKAMLESIINAPVRLFAYPNGKPGRDYVAEHVRVVRELGFDAAVSTAHGAARTGIDLYQLPRFTPWDRGSVRFMLRMAQNMLRTVETV